MFDLTNIITTFLTNILTLSTIIGILYAIFNKNGFILFSKNSTILFLGNITELNLLINKDELNDDELSDELKEEIYKSEKKQLERQKNVEMNELISEVRKSDKSNILDVMNNVIDDLNKTGEIKNDKKQDINKILKQLSSINNDDIKLLTSKISNILETLPVKKEAEILVKTLDDAKANISEEEKLLLSTLDEIQ